MAITAFSPRPPPVQRDFSAGLKSLVPQGLLFSLQEAEAHPEDNTRLIFSGESPFGNHRYETFMLCPRKYAHKYIGERGEEKEKVARKKATSLGTLVHVGLAHWYKIRQDPANAQRLYAPTEAVKAAAHYDGSEALSEQAQAIVAAYTVEFAAERVNVLHVEEVFTLDFQGAPLTARVDLIFETRGDQRVYCVDHKTTGSASNRHAEMYAPTGQFSTLRWIGQELWGDRFGGVILNLIQTDPIKFLRPTLPAMPAHTRNFPTTIQQTYSRILALAGQPPEAYPRHPSEHTCWTRYGRCDHYEKCESQD